MKITVSNNKDEKKREAKLHPPPPPPKLSFHLLIYSTLHQESVHPKLTVGEEEEVVEVERRGGGGGGGEVAEAEALREQQPRQAPGDRVGEGVALQRRQRRARRRQVRRPRRHRHCRRPSCALLRRFCLAPRCGSYGRGTRHVGSRDGIYLSRFVNPAKFFPFSAGRVYVSNV